MGIRVRISDNHSAVEMGFCLTMRYTITSLGIKGLKKQSRIFVREKVRFPFVVATISLSELLTTFMEGYKGKRE